MKILFAVLALSLCVSAQIIYLGPLNSPPIDPSQCTPSPNGQSGICGAMDGVHVSIAGGPFGPPLGTDLSAVRSVFGRTGSVVAAPNDYSFSQLAGSVSLAQLPPISFSNLQGTLNVAQVPPLPFTLFLGQLAPAQLPATMNCVVTALNFTGNGPGSITFGSCK